MPLNYTSVGRTYKICFEDGVAYDVVFHSDTSARRYCRQKGAKSAWRNCIGDEGSKHVGSCWDSIRVYEEPKMFDVLQPTY